MAVQSQKLKILYLMRILLERTDENHILNASDLSAILRQEYGMSVDRRTIYDEIHVLEDFGMDIVQLKGKTPGYYVASRDFELPELKLLVDAVQSAKFVTEKKSSELIAKLEQLCSKYEAEQLQRQVVIYNRPKTQNETIYYNVDQIHNAIHRNRQIVFQYAEWTVKKELRLKKEGSNYQVSPWVLIWDDENYYLIAYDEAADKMKHYRVDKMQHITVSEDERLGKEKFGSFNLATFAKKTFGMYGGQDEEVILRCRNELAGVVLDRFGNKIWMRPDGENHFRARVMVTVSQQFFGWITGIGNKMKIAGPDHVQEAYREYLTDILDNIDGE